MLGQIMYIQRKAAYNGSATLEEQANKTNIYFFTWHMTTIPSQQNVSFQPKYNNI